jgi:hypothetical protein
VAEQHRLEEERSALLAQAQARPGVADAIKLHDAVLEAATLREGVALAHEPQAHYGTGFAQPR